MSKKNIDIHSLIKSRDLTVRDLVFYIRDNIKIIILSVVVFGAIGFIKGSSSRDEFSAHSQLLPESAHQGIAGSFGAGSFFSNQLRQGAGLSDGIHPDLYPAIVMSESFLYPLLSRSYYFEDEGATLTLEEYFTAYYKEDLIKETIKFPRRLFSRLLRKDQAPTAVENTLSPGDSVSVARKRIPVLNFTNKERLALDRFKQRLTVTKSGQLLDLHVLMPDAHVAATLNRDMIEKLIHFIETEQIEKQRINFEFLQQQKTTAQERYHSARSALSYHQDHNRGIISQVARATESQLKNEHDLSFNLYNQLSQQLETARIKLEEAKPVITVVLEPIIPHSKANSGAFGITVIFAIVGGFLAMVYLGIRMVVAFVKNWLNG